jgi:UbiD family decarboxylase
MDLRSLVDRADALGWVKTVTRPVSAELEMANVANALAGRIVRFESILGHAGWRVVTGVCADRRYFALSLGLPRERLRDQMVAGIRNPQTPPRVERAPCHEVVEPRVDLNELPILRHLPTDAGPYVTAAAIIVFDPQDGPNVAFHRLLQLNRHQFAARLVENRGTYVAWQRCKGDLPCAICVGLPLQVSLAAAMSPAAGLDELAIANVLSVTPVVNCHTNHLWVPAEAELVMEGRITKNLAREGPFPDLTGTMDGVREQPVIEIDRITHRRDPIYHALLPGGLEHKLLMGMPREPTIFAEVNRVAECRDVLVTPGGGSWLHAVVQIAKRGPEDGRQAVLAAFRGHGSLKHVVVVDADVDIHDPQQVEWAIATRFQADQDLITLFDQPGSSLDPSGRQQPGQKALTSKMGLDATVPWQVDPNAFQRVQYGPVELDLYLDRT